MIDEYGDWRRVVDHFRQKTQERVRSASDHREFLSHLRGERATGAPAFAATGSPAATVPLPGMGAPKVQIQPAKPKLDAIEKDSASIL